MDSFGKCLHVEKYHILVNLCKFAFYYKKINIANFLLFAVDLFNNKCEQEQVKNESRSCVCLRICMCDIAPIYVVVVQ